MVQFACYVPNNHLVFHFWGGGSEWESMRIRHVGRRGCEKYPPGRMRMCVATGFRVQSLSAHARTFETTTEAGVRRTQNAQNTTSSQSSSSVQVCAELVVSLTQVVRSSSLQLSLQTLVGILVVNDKRDGVLLEISRSMLRNVDVSIEKCCLEARCVPTAKKQADLARQI